MNRPLKYLGHPKKLHLLAKRHYQLGQSLAEYGLIIALVAILGLATFVSISGNFNRQYNAITNVIQSVFGG
jgi:Flp pilus assembly pilin Flp